MSEGSVAIDGEGFIEDDDFEEESTSESEDIEKSSASEEDVETDGNLEEGSEEDQDSEAVTEKGTKLAKDPLQQANQLRANAESMVRQYEDLLMDPESLERYLEDLKISKGIEPTKSGDGKPAEVSKETQELLDVNPDKIETVEDLRNFAKGLQSTITNEIGDLKKQLGTVVQTQQFNSTNQKVSQGIDAVKTKYPELRATNPDGTPNPLFNAEFDQTLADMYQELDFDPGSKTFKGKVDLMKLADNLAKMMSIGKTKGSGDAQTIIKDKRKGKPSTDNTGGASSDVDESKMTSSQIIASRIKRSRSRGRRR